MIRPTVAPYADLDIASVLMEIDRLLASAATRGAPPPMPESILGFPWAELPPGLHNAASVLAYMLRPETDISPAQAISDTRVAIVGLILGWRAGGGAR